MNLVEEFLALNSVKKREVHFELCRNALLVLEKYFAENPVIEYVESVVGTSQKVDVDLPSDAFVAAFTGRDNLDVEKRFLEPVSAMQDDDLVFPDHIEFAYYAVYNLFQRYVSSREIDDWLIANQALSAEVNEENWVKLLKEAIEKVK
ncbi:MAG TPA: hypothetical protein PKY59_25225 [Pyrinomonadaceae bacterium]|nr:hypothetical protein [Pyrinomonadaceae bacterium]